MEKTQQTRTFKLFFAAEDIRRLTLANIATWESFHQQLIELYPESYHPELSIRYKDDEDDLITITCQREWAAMLEATADVQGPVRLLISEGKNHGRYFKDGPVPTVMQEAYVQTEEGQQRPVSLADKPNLRTLQVQLPQCLARLFPGGKVLPSSIPSWLEGCIEIKRVEGTPEPTLDLDVDVTKLFDVLHEAALSNIGADKPRSVLEKAKDYLQSMIDLVPAHPIANYNMACVHSLLGDLKQAAQSLRSAIDGGYNNLKHLLEDADLENLRVTRDWQDLLLLLKGGNTNNNTDRTQVAAASPKQQEEIEMVDLSLAATHAPERDVKPAPAPQAKPSPPVDEPAPAVEASPAPKLASPSPVAVPPSRWTNQHATLNAMGFSDLAANERLLAKYKGDVARCVNELLH